MTDNINLNNSFSYNHNKRLIVDNSNLKTYELNKEYKFIDGIYTFSVYKKKSGSYSIYKRKKYDYNDGFDGINKTNIINRIRKLNIDELFIIHEVLNKIDNLKSSNASGVVVYNENDDNNDNNDNVNNVVVTNDE